jgi:hypothetical protein
LDYLIFTISERDFEAHTHAELGDQKNPHAKSIVRIDNWRSIVADQREDTAKCRARQQAYNIGVTGDLSCGSFLVSL